MPQRRRKKGGRAAEHARRLRAISRVRTYIGLAGFVPLLAALFCASGVGLFFCTVPREWYLVAWAAIFGTFLGLTIRIVRERRRFEQGR